MIKREGARSPWERACAIAFRARSKSSCPARVPWRQWDRPGHVPPVAAPSPNAEADVGSRAQNN